MKLVENVLKLILFASSIQAANSKLDCAMMILLCVRCLYMVDLTRLISPTNWIGNVPTTIYTSMATITTSTTTIADATMKKAIFPVILATVKIQSYLDY